MAWSKDSGNWQAEAGLVWPTCLNSLPRRRSIEDDGLRRSQTQVELEPNTVTPPSAAAPRRRRSSPRTAHRVSSSGPPWPPRRWPASGSFPPAWSVHLADAEPSSASARVHIAMAVPRISRVADHQQTHDQTPVRSRLLLPAAVGRLSVEPEQKFVLGCELSLFLSAHYFFSRGCGAFNLRLYGPTSISPGKVLWYLFRAIKLFSTLVHPRRKKRPGINIFHQSTILICYPHTGINSLPSATEEFSL
jgi:hypothetical protein